MNALKTINHKTNNMNYQKLFDYMRKEHDRVLLENELDEVIRIVDEMKRGEAKEIVQPQPVDEMRFKAALAAFSQLIISEQEVSQYYMLSILDLPNTTEYVPEYHYPMYVAKLATTYADSLISELKKPK